MRLRGGKNSPRWSYETLQTFTSAIQRYLRPALIGLEAKDWKTIHRVMNRDIRQGAGQRPADSEGSQRYGCMI